MPVRGSATPSVSRFPVLPRLPLVRRILRLRRRQRRNKSMCLSSERTALLGNGRGRTRGVRPVFRVSDAATTGGPILLMAAIAELPSTSPSAGATRPARAGRGRRGRRSRARGRPKGSTRKSRRHNPTPSKATRRAREVRSSSRRTKGQVACDRQGVPRKIGRVESVRGVLVAGLMIVKLGILWYIAVMPHVGPEWLPEEENHSRRCGPGNPRRV